MRRSALELPMLPALCISRFHQCKLMLLSRALAYVRREVIEAWKRSKVKSVGKTMARAKMWNQNRIKIKTLRKSKTTNKSFVLINVFQLEFGLVPVLPNRRLEWLASRSWKKSTTSSDHKATLTSGATLPP